MIIYNYPDGCKNPETDSEWAIPKCLSENICAVEPDEDTPEGHSKFKCRDCGYTWTMELQSYHLNPIYIVVQSKDWTIPEDLKVFAVKSTHPNLAREALGIPLDDKYLLMGLQPALDRGTKRIEELKKIET